jgi:O-antigen/teichoic acid export membrane protein
MSQVFWVALARTLGEYLAAFYGYAAIARDYGLFGPAFELARWRELWRGGLPFGVTRAAGESLHHIGVFFLGLLADPPSVGTFAVAYRFLLIAYLGFAGIQAGLYPILTGYSERLLKGRSSGRLLRNYTAAAFGAVVAGSVLVWWFATEAITLLFGSEFSDSAAVLRVLIWALPFACLRVIAREALRAEGQERTETALMVGIAALQAAACFLLIPAFGVMACAWAAVATEVLLAASCVAVLAGRREIA